MSDISNKDSEQDVKIAVIDSTLDNATRRMELIPVSYTHLTLPTNREV